MKYAAWVTMADDGERLIPLAQPGRSVALLALGDRRSLIRRMVECLEPVFAKGEIVVWARESMLDDVRSELGDRVCLASPPPPEAFEALLGTDAVLVQPAAQVVSDEQAYREAARRALDRATVLGAPVGLSASIDGIARPTGIVAWPGDRLRAERPAADELSSESSCAETLDFDAGWAEIATWNDVHRLLAYVEKPWGYERLWALTPYYAGKLLFIKGGESLSLQYHEEKDETIRIQSGRMRFRVGPSADCLQAHDLGPGMTYAIAPRVVHQMEALEDCTVIEVSTPQLADVVRLEDRYGRA